MLRVLIGERILKLSTEDGETKVPVRVHAPKQGPHGDWFCRYSIGWPEGEVRSEVWGHDALQALHLTLQKIGVDIYTSSHHASGRLGWEGPGQGYGFPVSRNIRDLLVGYDARFLG